jgi:hypothetical protein
VKISVSDSGPGMTSEVAERAFEPFFTTKEARGSAGLGLSMVYGFIRQSGGYVTIKTKLGVGTTVTMYLPRADAHVVSISEFEDHPAPTEGGALVVADDGSVAEYLDRTLARIGRRARCMAYGPATIGEALDSGAFEIVIADVMCLDCGKEQFEKAVMEKFGLPVLFVSDAMAQSPDVLCLQGEFRKEDFAARIKSAIQAASGEGNVQREMA